MGMLDGLLGQVSASLSGTTGQQPGLVNSVLGMLTSGQQGGLQSLIQSMEQQGLGAIASSWVGTGQNLPISPAQIEQLLGNQKLRELAAQHGIDIDQIASHLAQILPVAVDKLTPNGTVPAAGGAGVADVLKGFMTGGKQ